jgi:hypothetical protein
MAYDEETSFILPRSHVGVFGPLLVIACPGAPPLGLDVALLDEIATCEAGLLLTIGELKVALAIADGPEGALRLVENLAPWVRNAPISNADVYDDAKRRLEARDDSDYRLMVDDDKVLVSGDTVLVGATSYKIEDVQERAKRGETFRIPSGACVQAAFLLLIVEAEHRPGGREGLDVLARRVADFESRG